MHTYLIEMLKCPVCHGNLEWNILKQNEDRIETAEARCNTCTATYPIRDGKSSRLLRMVEIQSSETVELEIHLKPCENSSYVES